MRLFKNIMLFAAVATALFTSCETDVDTPQISTPESFVAPVIGQCSDIIVNADNSANESVILLGQQRISGFRSRFFILYT